MNIVPGNIVVIHGKLVMVVSVVDQEHPNVKLHPDDLFVGVELRYSTVVDKYFIARNKKLIVDSPKFVSRILNDVVIEY